MPKMKKKKYRNLEFIPKEKSKDDCNAFDYINQIHTRKSQQRDYASNRYRKACAFPAYNFNCNRNDCAFPVYNYTRTHWFRYSMANFGLHLILCIGLSVFITYYGFIIFHIIIIVYNCPLFLNFRLLIICVFIIINFARKFKRRRLLHDLPLQKISKEHCT